MTELTLLFSALALFSGLGVLVDAPNRALRGLLEPRKRLTQRVTRIRQSKPVSVIMEMPDFCSILWFLISAGHNLENALRITVSRSSGLVSKEFQNVIQKVDLGSILQTELEDLATKTRHPSICELATKLAMATTNGSAIADQLGEFVVSVSAQLRSLLLEKATKSETKMMIPLVFVILPVTVIFALYPSVAIIQQSFNQT